jgi:hypothetical protein
MNAGTRFLERVAVATFVLAVTATTFVSRADAAWVNAGSFQVGGKITEIVPTAATGFVDPTCGSQGGTSLAVVRGSKLAGVDPILFPIVLVVSCLDNGGNAAVRSRLNFINPVNVVGTSGTIPAGRVVKQLTTTLSGTAFAPSNGWAHLVHRPDKGDLLGCGLDGRVYSIDYSQTNSIADGTATALPQVGTSCAGLTWDAEADMIYQGLSVSGGSKVGRVIRFKDGTTTLLGDFTGLPCAANGLAVSGGVLLMSCDGALTVQRLDKNTGASLGNHPTLTATGLTALNQDPGLGDLACDPVTFHRDPSQKTAINPLGRDLYRDTMWSRRGANGNGVAGLEFPAFTCGLPSNSVVTVGTVPFSPLAPGLSAGTTTSPGQSPLTSCFDSSGIVIDSDGDGLPDCWETNQGGSGALTTGGIDFDGDGTKDLTLCAQVNINGDGTTLMTECADSQHKNLFVQVAWMENHKPDPLALSQAVGSVATLGVKSVREAFAAAPVKNPDGADGIRFHIQVDKQPVTFLNALGNTLTSHITYVALTPCTAPATASPGLGADAADYDTIKATNFGVFDATNPPSTTALKAMRLVWRYVLFTHNMVGPNPNGGGSSSSGCSEVAGDDAVVSLGSFTATTVDGVTHNRGTTDHQAGTFMHEFGHLLGFQHGGEDTVNNKPNYRSVMSYSRQFSGSPILGRRLDYSRAELDLNEGSLNECSGLGSLVSDASLAPILPFFPSPDQIAYGPGAWSLVTPSTAVVSAPCTAGQLPINWNRQNAQGKVFQTSALGDINGDGVNTTLFGSNDWASVLYRLSAATDFAGGRNETPFSPGTTKEMTKEDEADFFARKDVDGNGIGDATDCGGTITFDPNNFATTSFPCVHRIDIKPSFSIPKVINLGSEATISIAIFSERTGQGSTAKVWDATKLILTLTNGCTAAEAPCLTFSVEDVVVPVKTNQNGQGTCSAQDLPDPSNGQKDGIKDLKCQFATTGLPAGTHFGVVSGFFRDPLDLDLLSQPVVKAFSARQEVTILP